MTIIKQSNGYMISEFINGKLEKHLYIGYTIGDSIALFIKINHA